MNVKELTDKMPKSQEISIWQIPCNIDEDISQIYKGRADGLYVISLGEALSEVNQFYGLETGEIRVIIKEELPF